MLVESCKGSGAGFEQDKDPEEDSESVENFFANDKIEVIVKPINHICTSNPMIIWIIKENVQCGAANFEG